MSGSLDRLVAFASASPFTGTYMSLATALGALFVIPVMRRLLPAEIRERHYGRITSLMLVIALLFGVLRLGLQLGGFGTTTVAHALGLVTTFLVATGAASTAIMATLEVMPARAGLRFPSLFRDVIQAAAVVLIAFGVLSQSGVNVVSLITTSAVLTAVIGLALQNTLSNLFAGVLLHTDRYINVGDWVQTGSRTGRIAQVRWRSTLLHTNDGDTVILPNAQLLNQDVHNFSRPAPAHRVWVRVAVHFRHAPNDVKAMLLDAASRAPGVLTSPATDCLIEKFGEYAVIYAVRVWIADAARSSDVTSDVLTRIWYAAHRSNVEIPYPIHTEIQLRPKAPDEAPESLDDRLMALDRLDLFAPLEPTERELLARGMKRVTYAAGEIILRQGEAGDSLFLIAKGQVSISIHKEALRQTLTTLNPGDFFGEMSLMTGAPRTATCTALCDTVCFVIDRATFQQVVTLRPKVAEDMSAHLAARHAALERKGDELAARALRIPDARKDLLSKIKSFFDLD